MRWTLPVLLCAPIKQEPVFRPVIVISFLGISTRIIEVQAILKKKKCVNQTWKMVCFYWLLLHVWFCKMSVLFLLLGYQKSDIKPKLQRGTISKRKAFYVDEAISKTSKKNVWTFRKKVQQNSISSFFDLEFGLFNYLLMGVGGTTMVAAVFEACGEWSVNWISSDHRVIYKIHYIWFVQRWRLFYQCPSVI